MGMKKYKRTLYLSAWAEGDREKEVKEKQDMRKKGKIQVSSLFGVLSIFLYSFLTSLVKK